MDETTPMPERLLSSEVIARVNADTVCQLIENSLKILWGEKYAVLLLVTDAAAYMKMAGKRFREIYCNAVHVTWPSSSC